MNTEHPEDSLLYFRRPLIASLHHQSRDPASLITGNMPPEEKELPKS